MPRRTLAGRAIVEGIGLHTGARTTARCLPAAPGEGIVFRRTDLPGAPRFPARLSEVRSPPSAGPPWARSRCRCRRWSICWPRPRRSAWTI